jgi:hypothetical protein
MSLNSAHSSAQPVTIDLLPCRPKKESAFPQLSRGLTRSVQRGIRTQLGADPNITSDYELGVFAPDVSLSPESDTKGDIARGRSRAISVVLAPQQIREVERSYRRVRGVEGPGPRYSSACGSPTNRPMYSPEANFAKRSVSSFSAALSRQRVKRCAQKFMRAGHPFLSLR